MGRVRITRPFVLLALVALLAPCAEAARTSVWESNPHASLTATTTDAAGQLASLASVAAGDVDAAELPAFDLGNVVLVESELEHESRFGLGSLALLGPAPLRGPPSSYPETRVRGFELLPPFRVGASPSLSLWSRQACGFSCREVVSDSRYDPWGLCPGCGPTFLVQTSNPLVLDAARQANSAADSVYQPMQRAAGSLEGTGRFFVAGAVGTAHGAGSVVGTMFGHAGSADAVVDAYGLAVDFLSHPVDSTVDYVNAAISETQERLDSGDHYGAGRAFTERLTAPGATAALTAPGVARGLAKGTKALVQDLKSAHPTRGVVPAGGKRLRRPYIRKPVIEAVEARAPRTPEGLPIDPNTKLPIEVKPDVGHVYGREFRRLRAEGEAEGIPQHEFNERVQNPDLYQLEHPSSNRGRKFEKPGIN